MSISVALAINRTTTALVVIILPDTVVLLRFHIARHLGELERNTRLLIILVEGHGRRLGRASRTQTIVKPTQAVLSTRPLGNGELAGQRKIGRLANVCAVLGGIEPAIRVRPVGRVTVNVHDVHLISRVDGLSGLAFLTFAELEASRFQGNAFGRGAVIATTEAEEVAVIASEGVAFPWDC